MVAPILPENAPFSPAQRQWLNGWIAGILAAAPSSDSARPGAPPARPRKPLLVLFGSQTGTAEGVAKRLARRVAEVGFEGRALGMDAPEAMQLSEVQHLLVVTSTYGEGEPPDNATSFWNWLSGETAPSLKHAAFSVLSLGDTNYAEFCEFGKKCDTRLAELGAIRIAERVDCDTDYEAPSETWIQSVLSKLSSEAGVTSVPPEAPLLEASPSFGPDTEAAVTAVAWSKKNPYPAVLKTNLKLTRQGSAKDVRHFEIDLGDSGLLYEPGDALGVLPTNCPAQVADMMALLCIGNAETLNLEGESVPLQEALLRKLDLGKISLEFLQEAAKRYPAASFAGFLAPEAKEALKTWSWGRGVVDVLSEMPGLFSGTELGGLLKKLQPRLYSIASSMKAHPGEVHLTVGAVRYDAHGRSRTGVCSTFLADRCEADTPVPLFVQPSHGFKLPTDNARDVIMVGPGTGIAPFRAFLEEREMVGGGGRNWLFFGDQRRDTDFLYQETLEGWWKSGHLARLDLAFSRDQREKLYVQSRMQEAGETLWAWLENGAHFYVCGDASRMAKDVEAMLLQIVATVGGKGQDGALEYLKELKSQKRYQRDVY